MIRLITLLLLSCSLNVQASIPVNGTFQATESCPAYLSKNSKTNPDDLTIIPNQEYLLKEINHNSPDWLRIQIPNNRNALRWVSASCGVTHYEETPHTGSCDNHPGMADSYVLALSSQPGFCKTYGFEAGKPECVKLSKSSYAASHLTLHGLWPNQDSCGQHYGFCGATSQPNHCDYAPVTLSTDVAENLKKLMPSYKFGSCLERHEWNKHGTCQVLSHDDYFSLAMRLATDADQSAFGKYLTEHRGENIKLAQLRELIAKSFGAQNAGKVYLGCKNSYLVDIFIVLPALIPASEPLASLINKAPDYHYNDSCPNTVMVSDFSKESWY